MHEIVTEQTTVEEACEAFAESMAAYAMGQEPTYVEQFVFDLPQNGTEDTDESNMARDVAEKLGEQARHLLNGDR